MRIKHLYIFIFLLGISGIAHAQHGTRIEREKIEADKVKFLKNGMGMTSDEDKAFWPLYNQQRKESQLLRRMRTDYCISATPMERIDKLDDKDLEKLLENEIKVRKKFTDMDVAYYERYKKVLGTRKLAKYYRLQEDFKHKLIESIRRNGGTPPMH